MGTINSNKKSTITTKGIDTTSLIDKTAFRGIQYTTSGDPEKAAHESKNYVTTIQFPVVTCQEDGSLTGTYVDKDGNEKVSHGYTEANMSVNIATMSDVYSTLAKHGSEFGIDIDDEFASQRSKAGAGGVPMVSNINVGGKTTFEIDAQALASESAKQRNAANKDTGAHRVEEDPRKARLSLTLNAVKATVNGVGKVTKDSLKKGLLQTATTSFIASNSEKSVSQNNGFRNEFDKDTLDNAGKLMAKAYEKAYQEVADALANGEELKPVVSAKDKKSEIKNTSLKKIETVKLIDSKGVKAFVQNPDVKDTTAVNADMRKVATVVTARANAYVAQAAYNKKADLGATAYNLVQATNFSINAIGLKQTIDNKTQSAGVAILSPSTSATITPTGGNATRLNNACTKDLEETKSIIGPKIFDKAESMAKAAAPEVSHRKLEEARKDQNKVIESVKADVAKAADNYDSIGKDTGKGKDKQAGE